MLGRFRGMFLLGGVAALLLGTVNGETPCVKLSSAFYEPACPCDAGSVVAGQIDFTAPECGDFFPFDGETGLFLGFNGEITDFAVDDAEGVQMQQLDTQVAFVSFAGIPATGFSASFKVLLNTCDSDDGELVMLFAEWGSLEGGDFETQPDFTPFIELGNFDSCAPAKCEDASTCSRGEICCPVKKVCEVPEDGTNPAACGDPHMTGFLGQKFDFTGEDGSWYCLIKADNMQVNMRVTSPVPSLPEITYITGLAVLTADSDGVEHQIVVEVKDPHNLESSCPEGVSPCLADGSLAVTLDGGEALLAPGLISLGRDVEISAANLPGPCRSFGFEQYWEMKTLENAAASRRLFDGRVSMGEWILGDPTATNLQECMEYVARSETEAGGIFAHQSEHASFQIVTPKATLRLTHGWLHQIAMRDPTDSYDLPDHDTWQMNFAVDHNEVSRDAMGVLGETMVPTLDESGHPIMQGMGAIRGSEKDYLVEGPIGTDFTRGNRVH